MRLDPWQCPQWLDYGHHLFPIRHSRESGNPERHSATSPWIPAFAGMTKNGERQSSYVHRAIVGNQPPCRRQLTGLRPSPTVNPHFPTARKAGKGARDGHYHEKTRSLPPD
jgi:hypothetical protein